MTRQQRTTRLELLLLTGALLALGAPAARAQDAIEPLVQDQQPEPQEEATPAKSPPITLSLRAGSSYAFRADLKNADASVARFYAGGGFTLGWRASEQLSVEFNANYEYADYDFNDASNIIPGLGDDPFDNFNAVGFSVSGTYHITRQWFATVGGIANGGWEAGAEVSDAWTGGGFFTVGYNFSDRLTIGGGVGASSQLDAEPIVFPAIFVRWRITDQLRLESQRLGARFVYTPMDDLDIYLRANWERREFRLDDEHVKIGDGILRDTTVPVGAGLSWRPIKGLTVGVEGGALVYSKIKLRNDLGNTSFDSELDPGAYVRVFLEYSF